MTWFELIWLLSMPTIFLSITICGYIFADDGEGGAAIGTIVATLIFIFGCVSAAVNMGGKLEYIVTSQVEAIPVSTVLTNQGLSVVTDEYQHHMFKSHDDVVRWQNGGKIYKVYSFAKVNFGPDQEKYELVVK